MDEKERFEQELETALKALRNRLDADFVARMDAGDFAENLLTYLRCRQAPRLFFSLDRLSKISALTRQHDPEEFLWEKEIADNAVEGRMYGASNVYCRRFLQVDRKTFDFSAYDHPDPQTIHGLGRHRWYASLARTYWDARNPKYFHALMDQWDFYVEKVPFPDTTFYRKIHALGPVGMAPPLHELDVYIRLTNWWWAYWIILHAEEMTPQRNAILLYRCLRLFDLVAARGIRRHEGNFTSMQMEALYFWSTALPEVTGMDVWNHMVRNTMESSLGRAVSDDGVQWEKSMSYHCGCIRWYGSSYLLGQRNGGPWANAYEDRLRKMGAFVDALITPDGNTPLLSDSDRKPVWKGPLGLLKCAFPDIAFHNSVSPTYFSLWLSDGQVWDAAPKNVPRTSVSLFPEGGVATARNRHTASLVILDNGPTHAGHSHEDNLTVHYEALGHPILVDPGRAVYRDDVDRDWVTRCQSHNTVCIEDTPVRAGEYLSEPAMQVLSTTMDPRIGRVESLAREGLVLLRSAFRAFTADPEAAVRRTVIFPFGEGDTWLAVVDEISANVPHTWTNAWLFPASQPLQTRPDGYAIGLESGIEVRFAVSGNLTVRQDAMFWCPNYAEKAPAQWVRFSGVCTSGSRAFLFHPAEGDVPMPSIAIHGTDLRLTVNNQDVKIPIA